ncbi:MAG: hypothetical protein NTW87_27510, partial [Planctomycetota bacterium]|nr:hypothetical protein [Planctomycetota bacterium]
MLAMVPVVAATVAAVWANLFLQYFVLMDAMVEIKRLRTERVRKRPVLIWAACAFMVLAALCQFFFERPIGATNTTILALAVLCICGALGCFWLHIWGEYKH